MIGDGVENGDENITSLNNPKVIPGSRQTEGCNKDSLPFSNPSCVVSSGFEQKIPEKRWAVLKPGILMGRLRRT